VGGEWPVVNVGGVIVTIGEKVDGYRLIKVREQEAEFEKGAKRFLVTMDKGLVPFPQDSSTQPEPLAPPQTEPRGSLAPSGLGQAPGTGPPTVDHVRAPPAPVETEASQPEHRVVEAAEPAPVVAAPAAPEVAATPPGKLERRGVAPTVSDGARAFAINLESALQPFAAADLLPWEAPAGYRVYTTRVRHDGRIWHRLRLGLFPTKETALAVLEVLHGVFPRAWVTRVSLREAGDFAQDRPSSSAVSDRGKRSGPPATPSADAGVWPQPELWRKADVPSPLTVPESPGDRPAITFSNVAHTERPPGVLSEVVAPMPKRPPPLSPVPGVAGVEPLSPADEGSQAPFVGGVWSFEKESRGGVAETVDF
jgi:hypothetical protein